MRKIATRKPLLMMRLRGLIGPGVQKGKMAASPQSRKGVKSVGNAIATGIIVVPEVP